MASVQTAFLFRVCTALHSWVVRPFEQLRLGMVLGAPVASSVMCVLRGLLMRTRSDLCCFVCAWCVGVVCVVL